MERVKEACKPDVEKFCRGIQPGDGRIAACLKSHDSELAPACHQIVDKVESAIHEAHEACNSDAGKFCQGTATNDMFTKPMVVGAPCVAHP